MSGRAHTSFRSGIRAEGTGSCVADSMDEEGDSTETFEISDSSSLRGSSEIAESLAESPTIMFDDRGNSLRNDSKTEDVGR